MSTQYSATEASSSKHPQDWGRAIAAAIGRIVDEAKPDGDEITQDSIFGKDLTLHIREEDDGVEITLTWSPRA